MTDREKAIVMAYTGVCMLTEDKFSIYQKYIQDICGRPIYTHELANRNVMKEIEEKAHADFIELCREEPKTDILDKIRDEIKKAGSLRVAYAGKERTEEEVDELVRFTLEQARRQVLEIIDKYREEN